MKVTKYDIPGDGDDVRVCPACKGTGWEDEYDEKECRVCWGYGEVPVD